MLFRRGRKDRKATVSKANAAKAPVSVVSPEVNKHIADDDAAAASAQTDPDQADVSAQLLAAQLRTLRAQISPHFLYNALNAVAAIIPMDPHRARELLLDFADFTRYTLRNEADTVPLAEELAAVEHYVELERARFAQRLRIRLQIAPEVLNAPIPHLSLQPLVENAVQHGLGSGSEGVNVLITAADEGTHVLVSVEDDGPGTDPARLEQLLAGDVQDKDAHIGLRNVDLRLRSIYGPSGGLTCETAPGAGMRAWFRVPKFHAPLIDHHTAFRG